MGEKGCLKQWNSSVQSCNKCTATRLCLSGIARSTESRLHGKLWDLSNTVFMWVHWLKKCTNHRVWDVNRISIQEVYESLLPPQFFPSSCFPLPPPAPAQQNNRGYGVSWRPPPSQGWACQGARISPITAPSGRRENKFLKIERYMRTYSAYF